MRHLIRRILFYLAAIWASVTLNFFIPRLAPGNPAQTLLGKLERRGGHVDPTYVKALESAFGVNTGDPLWVQYVKYLNDLLHGQLGVSVTYFPVSVHDIIAKDLFWTLGLVGVSVLISFTLGCLLGIFQAWKRGSAFDSILAPMVNFLSGIPYFWMALLILYTFGFILGWFPLAGGYDALNVDPGWSTDFIGSVILHAVLPACTIVIASMAGWMLTMRNSMITTLSEDYVLMAKAKGLASRRVMFAYAARNAILPNITGFAISIGFVVGGQLLTEMVFSYPGIGYSLLQAVQAQDYSLMQGIFLIIAFSVLLANFLADLLYTFLDPRVRQERSA
ncbi:ABC transporter permease [Tengunoibacter tsumagoiensis]|uniref:Peptide ABC transporter permease n=1 Tax=Tengunoibacter tsumagoiensis TaxID=2014871 RepID=A0A402A6G4_9CHLR|nr:ABC transporter permease [Tengunoibacter tsumagoiensis]GCE14724.1 peptide ABC transporter permease [Tengunoibacter tsumagoiensis]